LRTDQLGAIGFEAEGELIRVWTARPLNPRGTGFAGRYPPRPQPTRRDSIRINCLVTHHVIGYVEK
jgi:hypothetical protein